MQPFTLKQLVLYFLKLGATGFGGPIALVGYMQQDLVEKRKWFSREDYRNGLALAQLFPGPLASQLAIYFGFLKGRFFGATLIAIAFIIPSFFIICLLAYFYTRYGSLHWVSSVFYGMNATVISVIAIAAYKLTKLSVEKKISLWIIFIVLSLTTIVTNKASFLLFLCSGFFSLLWEILPKRKLLSVAPLELFLFFSKAAFVVYGGGIAVIPFIYGDIVTKYHWLTENQFLDAVAAGMLTPGPLLICVGFIGYLLHQWEGALFSVVGIFLPVYLFVIVFAPFFHRWSQNKHVQNFVHGVTAAAAGAIAASVYVLGKEAFIDRWTILIGFVTLALILKAKLPTPLLILGGGLAGIIIKKMS